VFLSSGVLGDLGVDGEAGDSALDHSFPDNIDGVFKDEFFLNALDS
jgi:hypothetical protein